jgi:hypothetical protein
MTPNYICPCCAYRGRLDEDRFRTILQVVADFYHLDPHDVEWGGHAQNRRAMEARNVAVYFERLFCAAMNKDLNRLFHWVEGSSNPTTRFLNTVEQIERDPFFARQVDQIEAAVVEAFQKKFAPHAISA